MTWKHGLWAVGLSALTILVVFRVAPLKKALTGMA